MNFLEYKSAFEKECSFFIKASDTDLVNLENSYKKSNKHIRPNLYIVIASNGDQFEDVSQNLVQSAPKRHTLITNLTTHPIFICNKPRSNIAH